MQDLIANIEDTTVVHSGAETTLRNYVYYLGKICRWVSLYAIVK